MHTVAVAGTFAVTKTNHMKSKTKKIFKWIPSTLAALMIVISASMKLTGAQQLHEHYAQLGLVRYMSWLGSMELLFIALFLYPRTMKIGFLFLTAYFGGAMAAEMSHGNVVIFPMMILVIVWIAAYLRNPSIFRERQKQDETFQLS
jgi:hypothetical protein